MTRELLYDSPNPKTRRITGYICPNTGNWILNKEEDSDRSLSESPESPESPERTTTLTKRNKSNRLDKDLSEILLGVVKQ